MRNLRSNLDVVHYKLLDTKVPVVDQFGNETGSYDTLYGKMRETKLCISPNKGRSEINMFGTFADYDRTMTTSDTNCEIDETAVLWIDGADLDGPWNYQVKLRAPWKNSISYAIKRVDITVAKQQAQENDAILNARGIKRM